jgi:CRP-like cAMP-binding protein
MFRAYSRTELAFIATQPKTSGLPVGTTLVREGEPGSEAFLIVEGTASVTIGDREIALLGPGDHFGELALLDVAARQATVTALTPLEVLVLGRREFGASIRSLPQLANKFLTGLGRRLHDTDKIEKVCGPHDGMALKAGAEGDLRPEDLLRDVTDESALREADLVLQPAKAIAP